MAEGHSVDTAAIANFHGTGQLPQYVQCTACGKLKPRSATSTCQRCGLPQYCNRACQTQDWKKGKHKALCKAAAALQKAVDPSLIHGWAPRPRDTRDSGGGGGCDDENECPICLTNPDQSCTTDNQSFLCSTCGQSFCGECSATVVYSDLLGIEPLPCPTCRTDMRDKQDGSRFRQLHALLKREGRHVPMVHCQLARMHEDGTHVGCAKDAALSVRHYEEAARAGIVNAQGRLAMYYLEGEGVAADYRRAVELLREASEGGCAHAMERIASTHLHAHEYGNEVDFGQAAHWFRRAADLNFPSAQASLADCYDRGAGVPQDRAKAFELYYKASLTRFVPAMYHLAEVYVRKSHVVGIGEALEAANQGKAMYWFHTAANKGHPEAQTTLGCDYHRRASGGELDADAKGVHWFQEAAAQNNAESVYTLGTFYCDGDCGLPVDATKAVPLLERAVKLGHVPAHLGLGVMLYDGKGIAKDLVRAVRLFKVAVEFKDAASDRMSTRIVVDAARYLAHLYQEDGNGVPQDNAEFMHYLRVGAEKGDAVSACRLGSILLAPAHKRMPDVPADAAEGVRFLKGAADAGMTHAQHCLAFYYLDPASYGAEDVDPDVPAAIRLMTAAVAPAAEGGKGGNHHDADQVPRIQFTLAQLHLGVLFKTHLGSIVCRDPPDTAEGVRWLRQSANAGYADAQAMLGDMYENGDVAGVGQDTREASFWLSLAAGQGHKDAQESLTALEAPSQVGAPH